MLARLSADSIRSLTMRLVACPSVSPNVEAETRCGHEIGMALPSKIERGAWPTPDGRPVVWGFLAGRTAHTAVLLGHYDTVGVGEFASLGDARGAEIAFDPDSVRDRVVGLVGAGELALDSAGNADLTLERREPGSWMFGRGALDMKSGLAAGIAVMHALAEEPEPPACGVLFIATPDEENESQGMVTALAELRRMRDARGLDLAGVLNLDYGHEPAAYVGAMGKLEIGCYVVGRPTHVGAPFDGIDASQLAAGIVGRVTRSRELVDRVEGAHGMTAVTLRLRDLKQEYNVQTALEAYAEFNLITVARPLERTLEIVRNEAAVALDELRRAHRELADWLDPGSGTTHADDDASSRVLTVPELVRRAGAEVDEDGQLVDDVPSAGLSVDARSATLERLRALCVRAGLSGPAVIVHLVPPYYPHVPPREGPLARAARAALADTPDVPVRAYYPSISDACYACWRGDPLQEIARHMPALGHEYHLPYDDARLLDLDVVNLGPWGRDGHGLLERVHAGYAFERLPRLVIAVLEQLSRLVEGERVTHGERT